MRVAKTILVIWVFCEIAIWIRDGRGFCVTEALPFVQRQEQLSPDYDWLALAALGIGLWAYMMLLERKPAGQQPPPTNAGIRTSLFIVPATIIALALLHHHVHPAVRFSDLFRDGRVLEHQYLAVLALFIFAIVLAIQHFRNR